MARSIALRNRLGLRLRGPEPFYACVHAARGARARRLAQSDHPQSTAELAAALQPLQASLAAIEVTARYASDDQELAALAPRLDPLRAQLRTEISLYQK